MKTLLSQRTKGTLAAYLFMLFTLFAVAFASSGCGGGGGGTPSPTPTALAAAPIVSAVPAVPVAVPVEEGEPDPPAYSDTLADDPREVAVNAPEEAVEDSAADGKSVSRAAFDKTKQAWVNGFRATAPSRTFKGSFNGLPILCAVTDIEDAAGHTSVRVAYKRSGNGAWVISKAFNDATMQAIAIGPNSPSRAVSNTSELQTRKFGGWIGTFFSRFWAKVKDAVKTEAKKISATLSDKLANLAEQYIKLAGDFVESYIAKLADAISPNATAATVLTSVQQSSGTPAEKMATALSSQITKPGSDGEKATKSYMAAVREYAN